jgi:hypothetical protein
MGVEDIKVVIAELQQEQLAFTDTVSDINFDVADDYDEFISKAAPSVETASSAFAYSEEPVEVQQVAAETSSLVGSDNSGDADEAKKQVESAAPVDQEAVTNTLNAVNRFAPAADTDRSIRDQVILPASRGHQAIRKERVTLQSVSVPAGGESDQGSPAVKKKERETNLEGKIEPERSNLPPIAESDLGDALINSPTRAAAPPAVNWLPIAAIILVLVIGLSIAAVFVLRPNALEPKIDRIQSWLEEDAGSSPATGSRSQ